jgi:hypothetical protein
MAVRLSALIAGPTLQNEVQGKTLLPNRWKQNMHHF